VAEQLLEGVRRLIGDAERALPPDVAGYLGGVRRRLDEPLRVAIAGRVKSGKSTMLNALVGERVAATDAGECTRVVTWYRNGHRYAVDATTRAGETRPLRFDTVDDRLRIDLDGFAPADLDRVEVTWPSTRLERLTLIDTPGMASLSTEVSQRAAEFLDPEDGGPGEIDAVVYLMRRFHAQDVRFLEAFHEAEPEHRTPINGIALLSRADELSGSTGRAMEAAAAIVDRWRWDGRLRRLCQTVIPVAGLLAETGATLQEHEFRTLLRLAGLPADEMAGLLLSVDRFVAEGGSYLPPGSVRAALLERFGMYGVRWSVDAIREHRISTSSQLASGLVDHSGMTELRHVLARQFERRADVLKARTALLELDRVLHAVDGPAAAALRAKVEQLLFGAHEIVEIGMLSRLRSGERWLPDEYRTEAERLLGSDGPELAVRLAQPEDTPPAELRRAAETMAVRYRQFAAHPFVQREAAEVAEVVVRTCEGLIVEAESLAAPAPGERPSPEVVGFDARSGEVSFDKG
jgi:hypothetical protein